MAKFILFSFAFPFLFSGYLFGAIVGNILFGYREGKERNSDWY